MNSLYSAEPKALIGLYMAFPFKSRIWSSLQWGMRNLDWGLTITITKTTTTTATAKATTLFITGNSLLLLELFTQCKYNLINHITADSCVGVHSVKGVSDARWNILATLYYFSSTFQSMSRLLSLYNVTLATYQCIKLHIMV